MICTISFFESDIFSALHYTLFPDYYCAILSGFDLHSPTYTRLDGVKHTVRHNPFTRDRYRTGNCTFSITHYLSPKLIY